MARPTPVLPEVPSTIVEPGREAGPLGRLDHGRGRAVLHAPAGVEDLELGDERAGKVPADPVEAHHRGVADEVEERVGDLHLRPRDRSAARPRRRPGPFGRTRPRRCAARSGGRRCAAWRRRRRAPGPTTPTWRGIRARISAIRAGVTSARGSVRMWCARAARRSGGWSVPTTTSRSMATCWPIGRALCIEIVELFDHAAGQAA